MAIKKGNKITADDIIKIKDTVNDNILYLYQLL